jgi:thiamine-monophosphate kinase
MVPWGRGGGPELEALWRERPLIARLDEVLGAPLDEGGDAALLPLPGRAVVSVDQQVEGVDFDLGFMDWQDVGWRALAAALSDLAAAGADAYAYFLVLGLPAHMSEEAALRLAEGMRAAADQHGVRLGGGDLGLAPHVSVTLTVVGSVPTDERPLSRAGARPGDLLFVTGVPGLAAAGLKALQAGRSEPQAAARFLRPTARLEVGRALRRLPAHAAIDVSDGLAAEAHALARLSRVGVRLDLRALPPLPIFAGEAEALALTGGDDYELLFAVPPDLAADLGRLSLPVSPVGEVLPAAQGVRVIGRDGRERALGEEGYQHGRDA